MDAEPADRLDSWKEIASYLKRSVRTVRRWEAEEGLPVHRHMHRALGSVYAYAQEIDAWRRAAEVRRAQTAVRATPAGEAQVSIVVLPFTNLSPDPDTEYFADGLTGDVIADLSKVRALRVISRTSAMVLKGTRKDVRTIGRELGVSRVVEGAVRRAGARLRVTATLIDAGNDEHLWAETFDGTIDDVFAIQERLARTIVDSLKLRLSVDEHRRLGERRIGDLRAYECYLRARYEALRWRKDSIDRAVQLLRNGLAIVGENVALYGALGHAYLQYREAGIDLTDRPLREAGICAERIVTLDPPSVTGIELRGFIEYSNGRIQQAVHHLKAAREIDPANADTLGLLSNCYLISGQVAAARPLIARLLSIDPLTPLTRCMPGWADVLEGDFDRALAPYRQMFDMDPGNPMARLFYVWVLALNGRVGEVDEVVATFPGPLHDTIAARVTFFLARALAGDRNGALAVLTPDMETAAYATDLFPRFLAQGYALCGAPDRAIDSLQRAVDRGFINYPFLARHDPFLRSLDGHPRFGDLLEEVRARWEAFEV